MQFDKQKTLILASMFGLAFIIRVLLFSTQGYQNDMNTFVSWFNTAADYGPRLFYSNVSWCDYPPFNVYLFWGFGSLTQALGLFGTSSTVYIVKLVPNIFDMLIGGLIYLFVRKQFSFKLALLASAFYIFNPAVIFNTAIWGQFDAVYTFFMLFSLILALKRKPELSAASFALSILTKPQSIALLPLVAFIIFKKSSVKRFLLSIATFVATILLVILPMQWSNPVNFLYDIYFGAYNGYAFTSINAFNFWGLHGLWVPDGNLFILGWILFAAFSVFTLYVLNKRWDKLSSDYMFIIFAAFMLFFAFFMLPTRIHERYLFPAISVLALIVPFIKKARVFYVIITATFLSNIAYVLYWLNLYANANYTYSPNLSRDPVVITVCIINIIMFIYGSLLMWRELGNKNTTNNAFSNNIDNTKTEFIEKGQVVLVSELNVEPPSSLFAKRSFVFSFNISKKDVLTMIMLSLIFFSVAVTSLGATQVPSNGLKIKEEEQQPVAILDLGHVASASLISFYVKDCQNTTITVYTGQPDNWFNSGTISVTYPYAYMNWHYLGIPATRYIRLEFEESAIIEINELIVLDLDNQLVPIVSITCENDSKLNFDLLIDEQDIVMLPRTYLTETMFDEVYFTRTAEQYLNRQWPYEWTHPPLGKLIIASGITIFGLNPFGWRIMGVVFGTLMIPVIFLLGKKMFGSYIGG
ncbi:MAG: hypothetical protein LBE70_05315, partial [Nitrososphaerota archaeon]|nr:hypothetical protein [Nitrososphaerota archaeon]